MAHAADVVSQSLNRPPDPPLPPATGQRHFFRILETRVDIGSDNHVNAEARCTGPGC